MWSNKTSKAKESNRKVMRTAVDSNPVSELAGFNTWGGAKVASEFWAKRLRIWLERVHGK
jgi:hypothetical protein